MLNFQTNCQRQKLTSLSNIKEEFAYLKLKNQEKSIKNRQIAYLGKERQGRKQEAIQNCVHIKDYQFKIKKFGSFSQNKLKKRKSAVLSNLYRPRNHSIDEKDVQNYIINKNMSLIKENIKKLQIHIPDRVPTLLKTSSRNKFNSINMTLKSECKTQRFNHDRLTFLERENREPVFLFTNDLPSQMRQIVRKRRLSQHFDRSKYFNCGSFIEKQQKKTNSMRQKTEHKGVNTPMEKYIRQNMRQKQCLIDDASPLVVRQKLSKPKTAGGFLKKYSVEEICFRPDFYLHLAEEQELF